MLKKTILSFSMAIQNIRSNLFHTLLSVLGIVIGVAALVAILSFIDGLEKYARDQITNTTSLNTVMISTDRFKNVGDIRIKKDSFACLDYEKYTQLLDGLQYVSKAALGTTRAPVEIRGDSGPVGAMMQAVTAELGDNLEIIAGRHLTAEDISQRQNMAVVNQYLARQVLGHDRYAELAGKTLYYKDRALTVAGIVKSSGDAPAPEIYLPVTLLSEAELRQEPPTCFVEANSVEHVEDVKKAAESRIKSMFPGNDGDFKILTNDFRVKQSARGFRLFRIIMGLIVGISILVGGVGVMNVLLISVKERTTEIGIRKAVGAKRRDIMRQFLAESIAISTFGSFLGLLFGVLATMVIVPVINALTELSFQVVYTWNTFFTISVVAILVGIVFGTYPAMKAAKLDPVEAIRRE
ncbi:MAG: ABC transporter permease [Saprospiraceae bacterium]|nr:ABC transporter permease [Saprospiraceae bacterium]